MAKNLEYWIGKTLSCRRCGNTRIIDWNWFNSSPVKQQLDKIARFSHCKPFCDICHIRGWENIETELAPWLWSLSVLESLGWEKLPEGSAIYWEFIKREKYYQESKYEAETYDDTCNEDISSYEDRHEDEQRLLNEELAEGQEYWARSEEDGWYYED